nr:MAG TPA: hypothetical protein [Caudoviricetes sp.]
MSNRKKYIVWRILYYYPDKPSKSIRICWRTDSITNLRRIVQALNPDAKIRLCYTEFK